MKLSVVYLWNKTKNIMGYTTDFKGDFYLSNELSQEQFDYLVKLNETRRMKRDVNQLQTLFEGKHGYPGRTGTPEEVYGKDGEYFVGGSGHGGQDRDDSIIDYNTPPGQVPISYGGSFIESVNENGRRIRHGECQPGLWCGWIVENEIDGQVLRWDGGEKFYYYIEWLGYLIKHFFEPWGIKLDGEVYWNGEESEDMGKIVVRNNEIEVYEGSIVYEKK